MLRRLECYILAVLGGYLPTCVIALGEDQRQRTAVVLAAAAMTIAAAGAAACANAARKRAATFVAIEEERRQKRRRKRKKRPPVHPGAGVWDDYAPLFDADHELWSQFKSAGGAKDHRDYLEAQFQSDFRLTAASWTWVFDKVKHHLERPPGQAGAQPLPAALVMATAMWHLATGSTYREVAASIRRGISKESVMRCVRLFTEAVVTEIFHDVVRFPRSHAELQQLADAFEARSLLPGIVGCIDGSHIRLDGCVRKKKQEYYRNRKGFCSMVLHAVVDPRGLFMDTHIGVTGRMGDSRILETSPFYNNAMGIFGKFGFAIYGDAAYPLLPWLLTGFRNRAKCTRDQLKFNNQGSRARVIVECAFGKLKSQWKCLAGGLRTATPRDWKHTTAACVALHNATILVDGAGWRMDDVFNGGRPAASSRDSSLGHSADPDAPDGEAPRSHIPDNRRAKAWRQRLLESLMRKLNQGQHS